MSYTTLIEAEQLQQLMRERQPLMVFDCSAELMQPEQGDVQYANLHIAGAVRANLERHLSAADPTKAVNGGRHPLPKPEVFAAWLASVGFDSAMQAVVYDRQGANYCVRLWWMLKWVGHEAVAVLNGGLQAWQAAQGAVASGAEPARAPSPFKPGPARAQLLSSADVFQQLHTPHQTLIDARASARFRGEVEPLDPVAGHIPGALNRPFAANLDEQGKFKSPTQLRAEFEALLAGRDAATAVHYCGSGVSALPNLLAMEVAGLGRSALYAGSWSEWCSRPERPLARA